jgi:opacity protein-like surface antigen
MRRVIAFLFVAALIAAVPASAQDDKKITVNVAGGPTFVTSSAKEHFGTGGNFEFGVTFNVTPLVGVMVEYGGNRLGSKDRTINIAPCDGCEATEPTPFTAHGWVHYGDFNLVLHPAWDGKRAQPYFLGGVGVYYRSANVTTPGIGYIPPYCDPWWYWCYPGGFVPVENVVGSRSETNFGINFGGGVNIKLGESNTQFYVEVRYHYVWGKSYDLPDGTTQSSTGKYLPILFGFKF